MDDAYFWGDYIYDNLTLVVLTISYTGCIHNYSIEVDTHIFGVVNV